MVDIEDQVIRAIQSYAETFVGGGAANLGLMAIAENLAPHIVKELGLKQEWGIVTAYTYGRDNDGNSIEPVEEIDVVIYESDNPDGPIRELQELEEYDRSFGYRMENGRRYLGTRLYNEWTEDKVVPLDSDLVELVTDDA